MGRSADRLSVIFAALADPTRRAILTRLADGPATVGEIAAPFSMSRPAVSQHLKVLADADLIEQTVDAQWRTCSIRTEPLDEVSRWVERHRKDWNERFDLLEERIHHLKGPEQ